MRRIALVLTLALFVMVSVVATANAQHPKTVKASSPYLTGSNNFKSA